MVAAAVADDGGGCGWVERVTSDAAEVGGPAAEAGSGGRLATAAKDDTFSSTDLEALA